MKKRILTLGIIITLLIPIIQNSQALALDPINTNQTKETSSQLSAKMLAAAALADDDPAEYELLWEPNRAKAAVHSIALSPNEQWLAVGGGHISGDNEIHLYFWFGGAWTHVWAAGDGIIDGSVLALAIDDMDGDGAYEIIAGSAGGYIYVYSIRTFNPDFTEQKATEVYQLAWRSADEITHRIWSIVIDDLDEDNIKEIIVGAGDASDMILRDIRSNRKSSYEPIGFIDEDPHKKGFRIHGVPILGPVKLMPKFIDKLKPDEILITSTSTGNLRQIYEICKPYNIAIKKLPELNDILNGNYAVAKKLGQHLIEANLVTEEKVQEALVLQEKEGGRLGSKLIKLGYITEDNLISFLNKQFGISHMKPISLEDLLQREPIKTNIKSVRSFIENKTVMVTGAGGSIGSNDVDCKIYVGDDAEGVVTRLEASSAPNLLKVLKYYKGLRQ